MAVRVLIADDHVALRRSLIRALQTETGMEVVGEAGDGGMAVELAKTLNPDIVIMDIVMPLVNGIDATRMFKAGASAYVLKNGDLDELVHAVDAVSHGETYLSPEVPGADSHHTPATG
jgi:DNA-binding NarL/FixJ family response regulator